MGGLIPQTLDHGQYFALILFKLHDICKFMLRKKITIVANRCHILKLKCTKFDFGWGSVPDLAGRAYSVPPDPFGGFKLGDYF